MNWIKNFNVLSTFDGAAMAYAAMMKAKIQPQSYHASEIDEYAITVAKYNVPTYLQIGDIMLLNGYSYQNWVDLLIGGSPCQDLSIAGKQEGLTGSRSRLFWEWLRVRDESNPTYWLLENVASMKAVDRDIMTKAVGVEPIRINSKLVSAQQRDRLYWTNIPVVGLPEDHGITLNQVLLRPDDVRLEPFKMSEKAQIYMDGMRNGRSRYDYHRNVLDGKAACLTANMFKGVPYGVIREENRRIHPIEAERLMGLPEGWTDVPGISTTQRLKMLGNGFQVDTIAWILSFIPRT